MNQTATISIDGIKQGITPILREYGVIRAAVFGSVARGETETNDVDILVEMQRPYGLFKFLSLKGKLEDILKVKVDLIEYEQIKPAFKERVFQDAVQIL